MNRNIFFSFYVFRFGFVTISGRRKGDTTRPEGKIDIVMNDCYYLTLVTLDATSDAGIFTFEACNSNREAVKVYEDHFEPEEDLIFHGLFCPSLDNWSLEDIDRAQNETSVKDWLIVAYVRNEPGILGFGTERKQWFHQWKGEFYKIC